MVNFRLSHKLSNMISEGEKKKTGNAPTRTRYVWLFGGLAVILLAMLVVLQISGVWNVVTPDGVSDTLALDALSSFVFVAFIIFAFIFLRSFLKLQRERSTGQFG